MADDKNKEIVRREVWVERGAWNKLKAEAYGKGKNILNHAGDVLKKHTDKLGGQ